MTDMTPKLGLPYITQGQAQKEVTHAEGLNILDAVVQLSVLSSSLTAPPSSPSDGDCYIPASGATGAWTDWDLNIAVARDGSWTKIVPQAGWIAWDIGQSALLVFDGSAWQAASGSTGTTLQNLDLLGVGTTADETNPLSARLNNTLFVAKPVAEGGDGSLRYKLSKEDAGKTASFLFQNNFSGRAEIGLTGDDNFHFKVSPDGSSWTEALVIDAATGRVSMPGGGGTWGEPVASWTHTTDVASIDFTGLGGYRELMVVGFNLQHNSASNQIFHMLLSADNGATFFNSASNYQRYGTASGSSALFVIGNSTFSSAAVAAIIVHLFDFNSSARATYGLSFLAINGAGGVVPIISTRTAAEADNALRLFVSGDGKFSAGTVLIFGKK